MRNIRRLLITGFFSSLFGLCGFSQPAPTNPETRSSQVEVTAQLNHLIMPIDRGERYENPLDEALRKMGLGETDGGGTMQQRSGEIEFIDVEIILYDKDKGIPFIIKTLEDFGAPKGSVLRVHDTEPSQEIPFGKIEGIAVYLDGVNLPDEVYASSDVNVVIKEFNKRLKGHGEFQSYWQGSTETALYLYGDDATTMKQLIADFIKTYPLCQGARIVTIAPKIAEQAPAGDN